jgi:hypothetical protein
MKFVFTLPGSQEPAPEGVARMRGVICGAV